MSEITIEELNKLLKEEQAKTHVLQQLVSLYEDNGPAKMYYSLNRKLVEMADLLNAKNLKTLDIEDPKDKSFERIKVVWNDGASLAASVDSLGRTLGLTGDEAKDTAKRKRTTPESIAEAIGDNKREDV